MTRLAMGASEGKPASPSAGRHLRDEHAAPAGRQRARRAFTLVELLVVVGLIILLAGTFAVALSGRSGEASALANAQRIMNGMVHSARAQAALHQTRARVAIYAQMPPAGDSAKYLRAVVVLREDPPESGRYVAVGDPVTLPAPVCVVPPSPVPANHLGLPPGQSWNNNVATGPVSTLAAQNSFSYTGQVAAPGRPAAQQFFGVQGQSGRVLYLEFSADGTIAAPPSTQSIKIAVATAVVGGTALPRFNNAFGVRGLSIRKTGAVSLVNGATGF